MAFSCYIVVFNKMQSLPLIFGGRLFLCVLCYNRMSVLRYQNKEEYLSLLMFRRESVVYR